MLLAISIVSDHQSKLFVIHVSKSQSPGKSYGLVHHPARLPRDSHCGRRVRVYFCCMEGGTRIGDSGASQEYPSSMLQCMQGVVGCSTLFNGLNRFARISGPSRSRSWVTATLKHSKRAAS